ncbi:CD276 antigen homolog isoform X2 [Polyodon spathula]|uniref:CD276 antigen homolog isoform X2 n=1 Tax=Polyodon spathula TaxID=7913 RepID=UPI001B7DA914|nr:CD276 antigen homolog isoform X2 [Polyodon spathula]
MTREIHRKVCSELTATTPALTRERRRRTHAVLRSLCRQPTASLHAADSPPSRPGATAWEDSAANRQASPQEPGQIAGGAGARSKLRKIKALGMAAPVMLMYWAIGIAAIQTVYSQETFIKVECDPESQGVYSQDAVLNCKVVTVKKDVQILKIMWCKVEADRCVNKTKLTFDNGKWSAEDPRFTSATPEWKERELSVSLLVRRTQVSDQGSYRFIISTDSGYDKGSTILRVTAPYSVPVISSVPGINIEDSMLVTLTCNASGGYPPGQIHWFDQLDSNWTKSSVLRIIPTQDGRFNLTSIFNTTASSSMSLYKCVVVNNKMEEQRAEYQLVIGPGKQEGMKNVKTITAVCAVVAVLAISILILYIHQRRSRGNIWFNAQQEEKDEHEKTMEEGQALKCS